MLSLRALLTAMAPAALQGAWVAMAREPTDPETYMPVALEREKNTCWVWGEGGPLLKNGVPRHEKDHCPAVGNIAPCPTNSGLDE